MPDDQMDQAAAVDVNSFPLQLRIVDAKPTLPSPPFVAEYLINEMK